MRHVAFSVLAVVAVLPGCADRIAPMSQPPALLDEAQAALIAQQYLSEQKLDWGNPVDVEPLGDVAFRLFYETSDGEKMRLGPRTLGVHRVHKTVWRDLRR